MCIINYDDDDTVKLRKSVKMIKFECKHNLQVFS